MNRRPGWIGMMNQPSFPNRNFYHQGLARSGLVQAHYVLRSQRHVPHPDAHPHLAASDSWLSRTDLHSAPVLGALSLPAEWIPPRPEIPQRSGRP